MCLKCNWNAKVWMGIWKISKPVNHVSLIYLGSRVFSVTRFITFCNFASRTACQWQVFDKTVTARILGLSFCSSVRSHHDLRPWQMLAFWSSSTTTSRLQYGQVLESNWVRPSESYSSAVEKRCCSGNDGEGLWHTERHEMSLPSSYFMFFDEI
jgi:hypothetical protein